VKAEDMIIGPESLILVTGASGLIGSKVVDCLIDHGFRNLRCFARPSSDVTKITEIAGYRSEAVHIDVFKGNLLSQDDCINATKDVAVIYHLAIGTSGKSFPNAFMNAVIPTRNLLEASLRHKCLKRFVNVSSFAVYSNRNKSRRRLLDESCPIDEHPERRGDAYGFAKLKQDQIVIEYWKKYAIPYVIVRPGAVYGPGKEAITGRVGIDTFGIFMHLGGSNKIPLTYVDNCAEAIVLAGVMKGIDGEVFNVVDDDLPSSSRFLSLYKRNVQHFKSIYVPHALSYFLCYLWEKYSTLSEGQLPPVFSRSGWHAYWKKTRYSNEKLKSRLGWKMKVPAEEGLRRYFESCHERGGHA
jgi:nucleoside-diphosphate-sugar epimerase